MEREYRDVELYQFEPANEPRRNEEIWQKESVHKAGGPIVDVQGAWINTTKQKTANSKPAEANLEEFDVVWQDDDAEYSRC